MSSAPTPGQIEDFAFFAAAAAPEQSDDVLDKIELFVRAGVAHIKEIEALSDRFEKTTETTVFRNACDPRAMREALWGAACMKVGVEFINPQNVEIGDVVTHVARALGWKEASGWSPRRNGIDGATLIETWSAVSIRRYFVSLIGDPREKRIAQLKEAFLKCTMGTRPEAPKWTWHCGSHHEASWQGDGRLRLPYSSRNIDEIKNVFRYIIHLATGTDPGAISIPPVYGLNDGAETWNTRELYLRQKNPFPGAQWLRFTAGCSIEFGLEPDVLARIQTQWDQHAAARAA